MKSSISMDVFGHSPKVKERVIMPLIGASCPVKLTRQTTQLQVLFLNPHLAKGTHRHDVIRAHISMSILLTSIPLMSSVITEYMWKKVTHSLHIFITKANRFIASRLLPRFLNGIDSPKILLPSWMQLPPAAGSPMMTWITRLVGSDLCGCYGLASSRQVISFSLLSLLLLSGIESMARECFEMSSANKVLNLISKVIVAFRVVAILTMKATIQILASLVCRIGLHMEGICNISPHPKVI